MAQLEKSTEKPGKPGRLLPTARGRKEKTTRRGFEVNLVQGSRCSSNHHRRISFDLVAATVRSFQNTYSDDVLINLKYVSVFEILLSIYYIIKKI